jgi:hypothetical protein
MRRVRRRAEERFGAVARDLEGRAGGASLMDWALEQDG